ncbi:MAG: recombinase family protein, partial [Terriglobales bacterium]
MTTMIPVVAYLRVSTGKQAEGELSIPDQRRAIHTFCQERKWEVVAEYIDHVSASDEDKRRPEFERMVDEGVRGVVGFKKIVIHSYSRYFRVAFQAELYRRKLLKVGIDIVSITQQFGEGDTADLVRQVVGVFDEFQSKEIRKHVTRAMLLNAELGFLNGRPPYGYKAVEA